MSQQLSKSDVGDLLIEAYFSELETTINYIAIVNNLKTFQGEILRSLLEPDIQEEFGHATRLAGRIRVLGYSVPPSIEFKKSETTEAQLELSASSIQGMQQSLNAVINAEKHIITLYEKIISGTCENDPVTADLVTDLLSEEQEHLRVMMDLAGKQ